VFAASRDKGRSERGRAFQRTLLDVIGPKISAELDSIQNGLQVRQNKLGPMAASVIRVFEYQVLVAAVVALILALAGGFFFGRSISRPVQGLTRAMAQIAAADGTRIRVPYATRPDEVGEMARALEDFRKRLIENEQLRSAKDRFLATLNHELRTPLNAIVGFADVLVSVGDDPRFAGRRGEYLTYIRDAGNTLVDLVNDILELYKTTGEREEVPHEPVVMRRLIEDAATMARAAHHNRDGDVIIDADPTLRLTCYPTGIRQTVLNLVTNAIKYSEAPYSVTVSLSRGAGGSLLLSVADRGVGISAEQIGEVVRPFARVQSTVSSQVVGTGLGLALVEMQVHAHDAVLQIESTPGVGSTFTIEFPGSRVTSSDGQHPAPSGSTEPPPSVSRVAESGPLRRAS
jgi:signal transduction histidine kinase